jgi:hypothetical protein
MWLLYHLVKRTFHAIFTNFIGVFCLIYIDVKNCCEAVQMISLHDKTFDIKPERCRHGRDRMVVGFTTTYAISAYHH